MIWVFMASRRLTWYEEMLQVNLSEVFQGNPILYNKFVSKRFVGNYFNSRFLSTLYFFLLYCFGLQCLFGSYLYCKTFLSYRLWIILNLNMCHLFCGKFSCGPVWFCSKRSCFHLLCIVCLNRIGSSNSCLRTKGLELSEEISSFTCEIR